MQTRQFVDGYGKRFNTELTGLEDLDWAKRLLKKGYSLSYNAKAKIVHIHDEAPVNIYKRYRREAIAHKETFADQIMSIWKFSASRYK